MNKAILLTGAPGTGKSTLREALEERIAGIHGIDYGRKLLARKRDEGVSLAYEELRKESSAVISPADVTTTDQMVINEIGLLRATSHVIIDSHALTREAYGFRAVPFSLANLHELRLDAIIVLRCDPEILLKRVQLDPSGRRDLTTELAREIQTLQESLSLTYAVACACPLYVIDTTHLNATEAFQATAAILVSLGIS